LTDRLRIITNIGYQIEFNAYGSLPRFDTKARRFKI
jgi:hypothetical protein